MNEPTLTRRSMMDRLKFLPRRPDGDPAASRRSVSKRLFGFEIVSISEILGVDTAYADEADEPAARAIVIPLNSIQASDIRTEITGTRLDLLTDSNSVIHSSSVRFSESR